MRKRSDHPAIHAGVALAAIGRITQRLMIRRSGPLKRPQVATHTVGRQPLTVELPHRSDPVTRIAVDRGVGADQRKAILMLIDGVDRDLPAIDPVAGIALRPVFPSMKVGMAVLAVAAHVGENRIDVAFLARHSHVHAAQRIAGFAVIKLRLAADRLPCGGGMAVLAGNLHRTVRTDTGRSGHGRLPSGRACGHLEQQERVD
jgi:hypothetical protein